MQQITNLHYWYVVDGLTLTMQPPALGMCIIGNPDRHTKYMNEAIRTAKITRAVVCNHRRYIVTTNNKIYRLLRVHPKYTKYLASINHPYNQSNPFNTKEDIL